MKVKRILFPTDYSDASMSAARNAVEFAKSMDASLDILHICEFDAFVAMYGRSLATMADSQARIEEAARKEMSEFQRKLKASPDIKVKTEVLFGNPVQGILDYISENKIDLVFMSTHGRTGVNRVLMGSVAERVVRLAPCAVMTVKV